MGCDSKKISIKKLFFSWRKIFLKKVPYFFSKSRISPNNVTFFEKIWKIRKFSFFQKCYVFKNFILEPGINSTRYVLVINISTIDSERFRDHSTTPHPKNQGFSPKNALNRHAPNGVSSVSLLMSRSDQKSCFRVRKSV